MRLRRTEMMLWVALIVASLGMAYGFMSSGYKRGETRQYHMAIAPFKKPRKQNVPGNLFVDESCIDCDTCRWLCPSVYGRKGVKSAVIHQPEDEDELLQAYAAMIACPTGSIRLYKPDQLVKTAMDIFPAEIDPDHIPGVMHLGTRSYARSMIYGHIIDDLSPDIF